MTIVFCMSMNVTSLLRYRHLSQSYTTRSPVTIVYHCSILNTQYVIRIPVYNSLHCQN